MQSDKNPDDQIISEGNIPLAADQFKLLINNVFTTQEIAVLGSSLATTLAGLLKNKNKELLKPQIDSVSCCLGKVLLSMPEQFRNPTLDFFKKHLGLDFRLNEKQTEPSDDKSNIESVGSSS